MALCSNCENWPKAAYEERDSVNPPPEFCPICIQSQRRQCCMWARTEPVALERSSQPLPEELVNERGLKLLNG
jgi:hypothetical protein